MTTGLIDPRETAKRAIQRGELKLRDLIEDFPDTPPDWGRVKLPEEVGLARPKPTPPSPKIASPHKQRGDLHRERRAKYLITKKDRPDLFP